MEFRTTRPTGRTKWLFTLTAEGERSLLERIAEETVAFGEHGYVFSFEKVDPGFGVPTRAHDSALREYRGEDEPSVFTRWLPVMFTESGTLLMRFGMDDATHVADGLRRLTAKYPAANFLCRQRYYKQRKLSEWAASNGTVVRLSSREPSELNPLAVP